MGKRYVETTRTDWLLAITAIVALLIVIALAFWLFGPWGLLVTPVGLIALVIWHRVQSAYRCGACGHEFEISTLTDLVSFQGIGRASDGTLHGWKLLRCPRCGRWSRARGLRITRQE